MKHTIQLIALSLVFCTHMTTQSMKWDAKAQHEYIHAMSPEYQLILLYQLSGIMQYPLLEPILTVPKQAAKNEIHMQKKTGEAIKKLNSLALLPEALNSIIAQYYCTDEALCFNVTSQALSSDPLFITSDILKWGDSTVQKASLLPAETYSALKRASKKAFCSVHKELIKIIVKSMNKYNVVQILPFLIEASTIKSAKQATNFAHSLPSSSPIRAALRKDPPIIMSHLAQLGTHAKNFRTIKNDDSGTRVLALWPLITRTRSSNFY